MFGCVKAVIHEIWINLAGESWDYQYSTTPDCKVCGLPLVHDGEGRLVCAKKHF